MKNKEIEKILKEFENANRLSDHFVEEALEKATLKERERLVEQANKLWEDFDKNYPLDPLGNPEQEEDNFSKGFKDGYQYFKEDILNQLK